MEEVAPKTVQPSEDHARQTICRELARLADRGCGQFRARCFLTEGRVKFEGEKEQSWQSFTDADSRGEEAASIAAVLETIHDKRNAMVEVSCHRKPDHVEYEIHVPIDILRTRRPQLAGFLEGQLFWD